MSLVVAVLFVLFLDVVVLWVLTVLWPDRGNLRQNVVVFVAEALIGYMDFKDDVVTLMLADASKKHMSPKDRMNGFLEEWVNDFKLQAV